MSSRQEEKERRREARLAAEQAAARKEARARRMRLLVGAGLAVAAVAAVIVAIVASGGDSGSPKPASTAATSSGAALPPRQITDLPAAAKAAGCTTHDTKAGDKAVNVHVTQPDVKYETNPPSYGPHNPTPASDGDYVGQGAPKAVNYVHSLEHGRIEYQYRPGTPKAQVDQLEALFNEPLAPYQGGQYLLLFENNTRMPSAVAAAAWNHTLTCPSFSPKVFDALRAFRSAYTLKGPELVNQPE